MPISKRLTRAAVMHRLRDAPFFSRIIHEGIYKPITPFDQIANFDSGLNWLAEVPFTLYASMDTH
jgi:hypothetical protein